MFKCPERELSSGDPSSPAHVQVMVPHVPHYLQLTLAICRAQTRCMMGHLTTLIHLFSNTTTFSFFVWGLRYFENRNVPNLLYCILSGLW